MNLNTILMGAVTGVVVLGALIYFGLPAALARAGLQPEFRKPPIPAKGKRALIVATSHGELDGKGTKTGVAALELTGPYYVFADAGMTVDLASIEGGEIPIDPQTLRWPMLRQPDRRFKRDAVLQEKVRTSKPVSQVDFKAYDIIMIAGGWGAAFDLAESSALGDGVSVAWANGAIVSSVCHGGLGLLKATDETGAPLVRGRRLTAVTDKQIKDLNITSTPWHPERDLRAAGAKFESQSAFSDIFASHVVEDGRLVTGQNQNVSEETAYLAISVLQNQRPEPHKKDAKPS